MLSLLWIALAGGAWSNAARAATASDGSATPGITQRFWLADPDNVLSPQQVLKLAGTPYQGVLGRGFAQGTTWIRLTIDPAAPATASPAGRHLVLVIDPPHLDEVAVFLATAPDQPLLVVGDTVAPPAGQPRSLAHFVLMPHAEQPFDVVLRMRNLGAHSVGVQLQTWDDAVARDTRGLVRVVAFLVFIGVITLWAGFVWWGGRDAVVGIFVAHQVSAILLAAFFLGLVRLWMVPGMMSPEVVDQVTCLLVLIYPSVTVLFHIRLLRDLGAREQDCRWLMLALVPFVFSLLLLLAGYRLKALHLTQIAAPVFMPLFTIAAWRCRPGLMDPSNQNPLWRRLYLVGIYLVMTALTMPQTLRSQGLLPTASANFSWFQTYILVTTALMGGLLRYRAVEIERRQREIGRALDEARQLAQLQQARAVEQSELVTMLTHELKTPLSVVSLALGASGDAPRMRERARQAVRSMKEVIDRCAQISLFEDRVTGGETGTALDRVDVAQAVDEVVDQQAQDARVDRHLESRLPDLQSDRKLLLIILGNLLKNALKYAPPEARIRLTVAAAARDGRAGVRFGVINPVGRSGRPDVERLFEKYHRGAYARHRSGSGLGLYLSKRLTARIGGELRLLDGEDVHFELWVPG